MRDLNLELSLQAYLRRRTSSACSCASRLSTIAQRRATWWTPPAKHCAPPPSRGQQQKITKPNNLKLFVIFILQHPPNVSFPFPQDGALPATSPFAPGSGDVQTARNRWHATDRQSYGEGPHWVQRSSALDERRLPRTGPRHLQTAGKVPQGRGTLVWVCQGAGWCSLRDLKHAFLLSGPSPGPRDKEPVWEAEEWRVSEGGHAGSKPLQHAVPLPLYLPGTVSVSWFVDLLLCLCLQCFFLSCHGRPRCCSSGRRRPTPCRESTRPSKDTYRTSSPHSRYLADSNNCDRSLSFIWHLTVFFPPTGPARPAGGNNGLPETRG